MCTALPVSEMKVMEKDAFGNPTEIQLQDGANIRFNDEDDTLNSFFVSQKKFEQLKKDLQDIYDFF